MRKRVAGPGLCNNQRQVQMHGLVADVPANGLAMGFQESRGKFLWERGLLLMSVDRMTLVSK